ncbi:hypothetical protein [Luteibacter sp. RCC_6_2]|uniref:hypothetical protein n=1 Tax=Luteibacter sp. RCC_6_2 TaxID=3239223 RepID=UPI0035239664
MDVLQEPLPIGRRVKACLGYVAQVAFLALGLFVFRAALAQTPEEEFKNLIRVDDSVQPLGESPFGERLSLYTGELSFFYTDVFQKGTGLPMALGREYKVGELSEPSIYRPRGFADWGLALPRIMTATPGKSWQGGDAFALNDDRCSQAFAPQPASRYIAFDNDDWWGGLRLVDQAGGVHEVLRRNTVNGLAPTDPNGNSLAGSYIDVTTDHWQISCIPAANTTGEGYLAVSPDGTRYYFNVLAFSDTGKGITKDLDGPKPFSMTVYQAAMLVSRIEDRFGNYINYSYSGDRLTGMQASDGRALSVEWSGDGATIAAVILAPGSAASRRWTFGYQQRVISSFRTDTYLTSVTNPDGSTWSIDFSGLALAKVGARQPGISTCVIGTGGEHVHADIWGQHFTANLTGPTGLRGDFDLTLTKHGRANVPLTCYKNANGVPFDTWIPAEFYTQSLVRRTQSGTGVSQGWSYDYGPANASWRGDCTNSACATKTVTETLPDGGSITHVYSNAWGETEGQEKQTSELKDGIVLRRVNNTYAPSTAGPYPSAIGNMVMAVLNTDRMTRLTPLQHRDIQQDGDTFSTDVRSFDEFAQPVRVASVSTGTQRESLVDNNHLNDKVNWVIGLPASIVENALPTPQEISRNVYDNRALLSQRYTFGRLVMSYAFDGSGQLASFTDASGHATQLSSYRLGVPGRVIYPDDKTGTHPVIIDVDDLSQITAITDQLGARTQYRYDAAGRLSGTTYPVESSGAWNDRTVSYWIAPDDHGLAGSHWVRTVQQGSAMEYTAYDAMLRPVLSMSGGVDGSIRTTMRTDYDWRGQKTFESDRVAGDRVWGDVCGNSPVAACAGISTSYDGIGRPTGTSRPSESNVAKLITTSTTYLSGARVLQRGLNGKATVTTYQMFGDPSYEAPVRVEAPESIVQTIDRDILGAPNSISQGGVTRLLFYDVNHRLCRTVDPESGHNVIAYDVGGNVAWNYRGNLASASGCAYDQIGSVGRTVNGYDEMGRLTSVIYPSSSGTATATFSYDLTGKLQSSTNGEVQWVYGYNNRGLMTTEQLSVDGHSWPLQYTYDFNGNLASTVYPDGKIVAYQPDSLGRPTQVGAYVGGVIYLPNGVVAGYTMANGAAYTADVNIRGLLGGYSYGTAANIVVSQRYSYDDAGNIIRQDDVLGQRTKVFSYDEVNRLLEADAPGLWGIEKYAYDGINNVVQVTRGEATDVYHYNGLNQLTSVDTDGVSMHVFTYDDRGNMIIRDGKTLRFDLADRLAQYDGSASYLYDASGRRVRKMAGGATTYYAYGNSGKLLFEFDAATTDGTDYLYLGGKLIASTRSPMSRVIGWLDGITTGDDAVLTGWTCSDGLPQSLDVHVYVFDTSGKATFVTSGKASLASGTDIAEQCHTTGSNYRFSIPLTDEQRLTYANMSIRTYGISPVGADNVQLSVNSDLKVPPSTRVPNASAPASSNNGAYAVTWTAVAGASTYRLQERVNGGAWQTVATVTGTSWSTSGKANGTYAYQVAACVTSCGNFGALASTMVLLPPTAPTSVSVPRSANGAFTVSWAASPTATSYDLYRELNGSAAEAIWSGSATSVPFMPPSSGAYRFRVAAKNDSGASAVSSAFGDTQVTLPPNSAPVLSGPGSSNTGSYGLNWSAVAAATSYNLQEQVNGGGWTLVSQTTGTSWSTGGRGGAAYAYQVQACNGGGCSGWSNVAAVVVALIPGIPSVSSTMRASGKYIRLTIQWGAVSNATWYESNDAFQNTSSWPNGTITNRGMALSYDADSAPLLEPEFYSKHRVRACNSSGCSDWSVWQ